MLIERDSPSSQGHVSGGPVHRLRDVHGHRPTYDYRRSSAVAASPMPRQSPRLQLDGDLR